MYSLCVCVCVSHLRASFCFHLPLSFCVYVCVCVCIPLIKRTRHTQFEDFKVATSAANGQIMTQFLGIFMLVSCSKCGAIVKRQLTTKATLPLSLHLSPFLSLGLSRTTKIRKICFNISFSGNFNNNKDNRRCQRCKKHRVGGWGELPSEKVFSNSNNIKRIA